MIAEGKSLSDVVARAVGWRGGDTNYWAYARGHVPPNCHSWEEMAATMGSWQTIMTVHSGIAHMLLPDGSTIVATEELVQSGGYWDVIVAYGARGAVKVTVRDQIESFKELLTRVGWRYEGVI